MAFFGGAKCISAGLQRTPRNAENANMILEQNETGFMGGFVIPAIPAEENAHNRITLRTSVIAASLR